MAPAVVAELVREDRTHLVLAETVEERHTEIEPTYAAAQSQPAGLLGHRGVDVEDEADLVGRRAADPATEVRKGRCELRLRRERDEHATWLMFGWLQAGPQATKDRQGDEDDDDAQLAGEGAGKPVGDRPEEPQDKTGRHGEREDVDPDEHGEGERRPSSVLHPVRVSR